MPGVYNGNLQYFLPSWPAGLALWLDGKDITANGVRASAGALAAWVTKGPGGLIAGQDDAGKQPDYVSQTAGILFNGTTDCLNIGSFTIGSICSVFVVCKPVNTDPYVVIEFGPDATTQNGFNINTDGVIVRNGAVSVIANPSGGDWLIPPNSQEGVLYYDGSSLFAILNDVTQQQTTTTITNTPVNDELNIGSRDNGAAAFFNGNVSEVIIYDRAITSDQLDSVWFYFKRRWGL